MKYIPENSIVGITTGCFDILHPTHLIYLKKCRRECNYLLVMIDSDRLVTQNKRVPTMNEEDRLYMVKNLKPVSDAEIFDSLEEFENKVVYLSESTTVKVFKHNKLIYGTKVLEFPGIAEVVIIPDVKRYVSTTEIIEHLKKQ